MRIAKYQEGTMIGNINGIITTLATVILALLTLKYVKFTKGILDATNINQKLIIDEQKNARRENYLFNLIEAWNSAEMMTSRIFASNRIEEAKGENLRDFMKGKGQADEWFHFALVAHFIVRVVTCVENNFITEEDATREFPYLRWWSDQLIATYAAMPTEGRIVRKMDYVLRTFPLPPPRPNVSQHLR
jgi:hypothetical protein